MMRPMCLRRADAVMLLAFFSAMSPLTAAAQQQTVTVSGDLRILDGDTIEIGLLRIRIHAIDAPEDGQTCSARGGGTWPCGRIASDRIAELVGDAKLDCEPLERDLYGRLIARCLVGDEDIGAAMVSEGLAWSYTQFSDDYVSLEGEARARGRNIWQAPTQTAKEYRDDVWARAVEASPAGCPIKGNINRGQKIYHTPWSLSYEVTQIREDRGEKWFCSEAKALEAGWRQVRSR